MADANTLPQIMLQKLISDNAKINIQTVDLTDATKREVATGLTAVAAVLPGIQVNAVAVAATSILAVPSATAGAVDLTAVGATGTTTVTFIAFGY